MKFFLIIFLPIKRRLSELLSSFCWFIQTAITQIFRRAPLLGLHNYIYSQPTSSSPFCFCFLNHALVTETKTAHLSTENAQVLDDFYGPANGQYKRAIFRGGIRAFSVRFLTSAQNAARLFCSIIVASVCAEWYNFLFLIINRRSN